jgi:hypothetical protein
VQKNKVKKTQKKEKKKKTRGKKKEKCKQKKRNALWITVVIHSALSVVEQ